MASRKVLYFIGLSLIMNALNAQVDESDTKTTPRIPVIHLGDRLKNETFYTGVDGRFVVSFANDSIVQARFFTVDQFQRYQEIHYHTNGDTIFLHNSSRVRVPYSVCSPEDAKIVAPENGIPVVVKFFAAKQLDAKKCVQERVLLDENVYYMDSISQQLYIPYKKIDCLYSNILAISYKNYYARLYKDIDTSYGGIDSKDYLKIDMSGRFLLWQEALFNEFPLVIKGDSIFPVDDEKNYQCWIDNGFFFPVMIKSHDKPWEAGEIPNNRIGLEGIKFEF